MDEEKVPDEVQMQLRRFSSALDRFEGLINGPLTAYSGKGFQELTPLQQSVHHLGVAKAVCQAYILLLRVQGLTGKSHPINKEVERLKAYGKKVRKLESAEYLATHRPSTELNIAAANRFINHAIPDLNAEQKAALKTAGNKRREAVEAKTAESPADMARAFLEQTLGPLAKRQK